MKYEGLVAGGLIVGAIVIASFTLDGETVPNTKLPGGSEACTYHAGPMDGDLIAEGKDAGQRILRKVLALDHSCEFVTLAFPDGTRQIMQLGKAGRKPGDPGPGSM